MLLLLGVAACNGDAALSPPTQPSPPPSSPQIEASLVAYGAVQTWTLILRDTVGRVWIAQTDPGAQPGTTGAWPVSLWARLDSAPMARGLTLRTWVVVRREQAGPAPRVVVVLRWVLEDDAAGGGTVASAVGGGVLRGDWRHGVQRARGRARGLGGTRLVFDAISDTPMPAEPVDDGPPAARVVVRTPGVVSLRIDDCNGADAQAYRLLRGLGLVAAMGIPTRRLGLRGHCDQALLEAMVADGNTVEAHSRLHGAAPPSFGDFYLEVVGSALDLRRRGFDPHVFVQPGTWRQGPSLLDSGAKLRGPFFELLRRVYVSTEAYAWPPAWRFPVSGRQGPSHFRLNAFTPAEIEARLRWAARDSQWISYMWHSWDMPPVELEARLRVIAALRDSGLVTVLPYYPALHAVRE